MCWVAKFILGTTILLSSVPGDGFGGQNLCDVAFLMTSRNRVSRTFFFKTRLQKRLMTERYQLLTVGRSRDRKGKSIEGLLTASKIVLRENENTESRKKPFRLLNISYNLVLSTLTYFWNAASRLSDRKKIQTAPV